MAREWLDKSPEAQQKVSERMVKVWEKNRQGHSNGSGESGEACGVSLYQSYKKVVEQWHRPRQQAISEGGNFSDKPPGFNEWMENDVDPQGELRRKCRAEALDAYRKALLKSEPTLDALAEETQTKGPLSRREEAGYKPFTLTKMLLVQFLDEYFKQLSSSTNPHAMAKVGGQLYSGPLAYGQTTRRRYNFGGRPISGGFVKWLEARDQKRAKHQKAHRDWLEGLKKDSYYSATKQTERKRPWKKHTRKKPVWNDSPPSPPPEGWEL